MAVLALQTWSSVETLPPQYKQISEGTLRPLGSRQGKPSLPFLVEV